MNCADVSIAGNGAGSFTGKEMVVLNIGRNPIVPEFASSADKGQGYYSAARSITISSNGGSVVRNPQPATPPPVSLPPAPLPPPPSRNPERPTVPPSQRMPSTPPKTPSPVSCDSNRSYCLNSKLYAVCDGSGYFSQRCAAGTRCVDRSGNAVCEAQRTAPAASPEAQCITGDSRCSGRTTRSMCSNGVWYYFTCAAGTGCAMRDSVAYCDVFLK
jgi:hypothetical protein